MTTDNPTNSTPEPEAAPATAPAAPEQAQAPAAGPPAHGGGGQRDGRDQRRDRRGGRQGGRRGPRRDDRSDESGVESSVVRIYRCAKVVKGGRTFSFGALVVVGDRKGSVGIGYGKANEVPNAVEKATKEGKKSMFKVNLKGGTIPHAIRGRAGASTVTLVPAMPGTGVTAGKSVRPCLELSGITDILSKAYGSTSPKNLVKATLDALRRLQNVEQIEEARGVSVPRKEKALATA